MAKVLLVEDDNNLREIYQARLQAEGYTIVSAQDGEEALVVAKAEKPDLVVSDVMMPKISGFEMLDILRNTEGLKDVKVIMLTALGQSDDQSRANKLGADRYLVKSQVTLEDIVKATHELLDSPEEQAGPAVSEPLATATAPATPPPVAAQSNPAPSSDPDPVATPPPAAEPVATPPSTNDQTSQDSSTASTGHDTPAAAAETPPVPSEQTAAPAESSSSAETPDDPPNTAQTAAEEEAKVESQIESFVAGATTEPSAPPDQPGNESSTPPAPSTPPTSPEPSAPTDTAADNTTAANDDKVLAEAVNTLTANTSEEVPSVSPVNTAAQPANDNSTAATPSPTDSSSTDSDTTSNNNVTIAHKKIITPLDSQPKQDLQALLAAEEAKEISMQPASPGNVISDNTNGPPAASESPTISESPTPEQDPPASTDESSPPPDPITTTL